MTYAEKLQKIYDAKVDIRLAINAKGVYIPPDFPFSQYADKVRAIDQVLSGEGFGAVIGTPSGDYYIRVDVYFYNSYLDSPRFFTSSTVYGPYTEVTELPITITETTTLFVFASDGIGENFTSIYRFVWNIRGAFFEDTGVLPTVEVFTLSGSDDICFEVYPDQNIYIPFDTSTMDSVSVLNARDTLTIERG